MNYHKTGRKTQIPASLPFWTAALLTAIFFIAGTSGSIRAAEPCIDLADEPLEIASMGAPGMVMFVYDNSGSMAWSVMTEEDEGLFHTTQEPDGYGYVYTAEKGTVTGAILQDSVDNMRWKTQWAGYNKVYYNPNLIYEPWPAWTEVADIAHAIPAAAPQADPDNPLLFVVRDNHGETMNLSDTWATVDMGGGFNVCDLLDPSQNPNAVIVDNVDTTSVREIVVDDVGDGINEPGFSYTGNPGYWNFWSNEFDYYGSDYMNYYGDTNPLPVSATWDFDVATAGNYEVLVSVSKYSTRTTKAVYTVSHAGGTTTKTISQYDKTGPFQEWMSLGTYDFNVGAGAGQVVLNFTDTKSGNSISVDAMRLVPTFTTGNPDTYFTSTGPWSFANTATGFYGTDYMFSNMAGDYAATWTAENLAAGTPYSAYVRWGANVNRSDLVNYTVDGDIVTVNQRLNSPANCYWTLLKDNISFFKDTGVVELNHYTDFYGGDSVSADAVAFVPTPAAAGTTVNIVMAHYFVQNANGTFLVNLDGAIQYYRVLDDVSEGGNGDGIVGNGELGEMTVADAQAAGIYQPDYAQARQNFANWFQFSRTRDHVGRYALATLVESMGNIYFGLSTVPPRDVYAIRAVKESKVINRDDTLEIYNNVYNLPDPNGSTPLKDGFMQVADFFEGAASLVNAHDKAYFIDGGYATDDTYPYLNEENGGHCQQAFMIAMTDGLYNMNQGSNVLNNDGDDNTEWDGGEFADPYDNTLADISMDFYERDLKSDDILIDEVPTNEWDQNKEQHLVTYALTFGVTGNINPALYPNCPKGVDCPDWPLPVEGELTTIDDVYHATVNGRGMFLNAGNPQELVEALRKIKENIEERLGSSAAVSTNSIQRQIGSKLYRGQYTTGKWSGDLQAYDIDVTTGAVDTSEAGMAWSAQEELDDFVESEGFEQRKIYSFDGTNGILFDINSMTADQITRLESGITYAFGTGIVPTPEALVDFIRGDRSNERSNGGPFRSRSSLLGDIVHSEAEYNDRVLYVGANDGMLHAFHSETGEEQGAYVPNMLYSELGKLAAPNYQHQYYINNTPSFTNIGDRKLLVCPMAKGYKGLFMVDVSAPLGEANAASVGVWEYPGAGVIDPDLGYTYSYASILKTEAEYNGNGGWVVITGNGYDSTNGHAILYVFNALTGEVIRKLDTLVGDCNGLSSPIAIDPDGDGNIDFCYAGDLKGNMWKFDLRGTSKDNWKIAFDDGGTPKPLVTITDGIPTAEYPGGTPQSITNIPDVTFVNNCNPPGSKGFLVIFGTGKYLGLTDLNDISQQSVYAVYDWAPDWEIKDGQGTASDNYLGTLTVGSPRKLSNSANGTGKDLVLVEQTITTTNSYDGTTYRYISDNPVIYYNVEADAGEALGWYINLPDDGERAIRRPVIRNNNVLIIANIPEKSVCSAGGRSVFYQFNACTGGWPEGAQFDVDGDGDFDEDDMIGEPVIPTDAELLASAYDADGDGDVDWDDVLAIHDSDGDGSVSDDERQILQPPVGKEYDTMLLDITILGDTAYTPDADAGEIPDEDLVERRGFPFWQIIE